ncbi:hypothetical protein N9542_03160 [Methylophilaceae bacterium]|nr:hypothetical protein [Methylophilaceae bacterium]
MMQYINDYRFDDIAGTFGDGASHSIAYFSLATIALCFVTSKKFTISIFIFIAILLNIVAENPGFFVLLFLIWIWNIYNSNFNYKLILYTIIIFTISFILLNYSYYSNAPLFDIIYKRAFAVLQIPNYFDANSINGRADFLFLGFKLGGWFGAGPGAYSNIYLMDGFKIATLPHPGINISEASHLLAETGIIGFILTITNYFFFLTSFKAKLFPMIFTCILLILCFFYTAILSTEPQIVFLIITIFVLSKNGKNVLRNFSFNS